MWLRCIVQTNLSVINCNKWKLKLNKTKTKVIVSRKGGLLPRHLKFYYDNTEQEIVSSFTYHSFSTAQQTLAVQDKNLCTS